MNSHVIPSQTVAELKRLNGLISELELLKSAIGINSDQEIRLRESKERLTKIIEKL